MTTKNSTLEQQDHEELVEFLERDQLVTDKSRPLPRARLSRRAAVALWALRVFVIIVAAMVIYTFFSQLGS
jgi:4-hydroxybenzoate polyprenyltransferase